jgi:hypothetical protein
MHPTHELKLGRKGRQRDICAKDLGQATDFLRFSSISRKWAVGFIAAQYIRYIRDVRFLQLRAHFSVTRNFYAARDRNDVHPAQPSSSTARYYLSPTTWDICAKDLGQATDFSIEAKPARP